LPDWMLQRGLPVGHIDPYLALIDHGLFAGEEIFDRVFNGEDVKLLAFVDGLKQSSQGGTLAAPGHSGNDDESLIVFAKPLQHGRQPKLLDRRNFCTDAPGHHAQVASLLEEVDAEPASVS